MTQHHFLLGKEGEFYFISDVKLDALNTITLNSKALSPYPYISTRTLFQAPKKKAAKAKKPAKK